MTNIKKKKTLRYSPPKSSCWGHAMGRKSPVAFCDGLDAFWDEAVETRLVSRCTIWTNADDIITDSSLGYAPLPINRDGIAKGKTISENEFEQCVNWLDAHRPLIKDLVKQFYYGKFFLLDRDHEVTWRCFDEIQPRVTSRLSEGHGTFPILGTDLAFGSVDEYCEIKRIMKRTLGIKMNDKHLRPKDTIVPGE